MQNGTIYLIRHGKTEGNVRRLYYGSSDISLVSDGEEEIRLFSAEGIYPDAEGAALFTSGLMRTDQTFQLIYGEAQRDVLPKLREYNFGAFEMHSYEELKEREDYQRWIEDQTGQIRCTDGESVSEFFRRVEEGFAELLRLENEKVIVVCHGGVISAIMMQCFPNEKGNFYEWQPHPGRGYAIQIRGGVPDLYCSLPV